MSYMVYLKYGSKKYKLPVNPEEIKVSRDINVETYNVLGSGQVSIPSYMGLAEYSFEAEFPSTRYHYVNRTGFKSADYFEKMFKKAQKNLKPIRLIASNGINDDISVRVLIKSVEILEKAGEEGDKYISLNLLEYKAANTRYVAVQTQTAVVKQEESTTATGSTPTENPNVTENKTHTVVKGDTLWGLAKKYYGNGNLYTKIVNANPKIKNPNKIYDGDVLTIPQ